MFCSDGIRITERGLPYQGTSPAKKYYGEFRYGAQIRNSVYGRSKTLRKGLRNGCFSKEKRQENGAESEKLLRWQNTTDSSAVLYLVRKGGYRKNAFVDARKAQWCVHFFGRSWVIIGIFELFLKIRREFGGVSK